MEDYILEALEAPFETNKENSNSSKTSDKKYSREQEEYPRDERKRPRDSSRDSIRRYQDGRKSRSYDDDRRSRGRERGRYERDDRNSERTRDHRKSNRSPRRKSSVSRSPSPAGGDTDKRTVFVMQIAQRARSPDLAKFFEQAGRVRKATLVYDKISRRSKGVGYVEFSDELSVPKAVGMTGQKLMGIPVLVQRSEAEKNRTGADEALLAGDERVIERRIHVFTRLTVSCLHPNLKEEDVKKLFEGFGRLEEVVLIRDFEGQSKGVANVQFKRHEDARRALETMNGFIFTGWVLPLRVSVAQTSNLTADEAEIAGMSLDSKGRAELMSKLAASRSETTELFKASRCVLLSNLYDAREETGDNWDEEIEQDVRDECLNYGMVLHIKVTKSAQGEVYVKFDTPINAAKAIQALNGRFFANKKVGAVTVAESAYDNMFNK